MKKVSYEMQILVFLFWIPIVVALFKFIAESRVAAIFAGAGFIFIPCFFLMIEWVKPAHRSIPLIASQVQFLLLFAVPIFALRIYFWSIPFKQIEIFGISPEILHRYSNVSYFMIVVVLAVKIVQQQRNKKRQPKG